MKSQMIFRGSGQSMASMKDVAKRAKVGTGTVSRYVNNSGYISDATKIKIAKAIKELDYIPNQLARNLASNSTMLVGLIIPDLEHPFFATFAKHVENKLYSLGYKTLICNTIGISDREKIYVQMLDSNMVDGIITCSQSLSNELYANCTKPVVSFDHDYGSHIPIVCSDHRRGGELAAHAIIRAGCKNVIQFMTPSKVPTPSNERHEVFARILQLHGVNVITCESKWNVFEREYYYDMFKEKLNGLQKIDGIFMADLGAVCCLQVLHEKGMNVPDDISLIGYDGLSLTDYTNPKITTIVQNTKGLAYACVNTVIDKIQKKSEIPSKIIMDVFLKEGASLKYKD